VGCSRAEIAGLEANIHPVKTLLGFPPVLKSITSRKTDVSGVSSGGLLSQYLTKILKVPKRICLFFCASNVDILAVTLSSPLKIATSYDSAWTL
tara:strand:+ start:596 stop:877 length:282 start_codon:yes stop_codon:yes gene_type:complete